MKRKPKYPRLQWIEPTEEQLNLAADHMQKLRCMVNPKDLELAEAMALDEADEIVKKHLQGEANIREFISACLMSNFFLGFECCLSDRGEGLVTKFGLERKDKNIT